MTAEKRKKLGHGFSFNKLAEQKGTETQSLMVKL